MISTYKQYNGTTSAIPGTITQMVPTSLIVRRALLICDAGNTQPVQFGPDNTASLDFVRVNAPYTIPHSEAPSKGDLSIGFDLSAWYVQSAMASAAYRILYLV